MNGNGNGGSNGTAKERLKGSASQRLADAFLRSKGRHYSTPRWKAPYKTAGDRLLAIAEILERAAARRIAAGDSDSFYSEIQGGDLMKIYRLASGIKL